MDTQTALMTRRSIRRYTDRPVDEQAIDALLRAAMQAPSAVDCRPWQFVQIDNKALLESLGGQLEGCDMLKSATAGMLICAEPAREIAPGFWPQDCSCAAHNIQLMAHAMGIGAVWVGLYPMEERMAPVREACGIPEEAVPFALIALGYPDEDPGPEDRYDPERIHRNRW